VVAAGADPLTVDSAMSPSERRYFAALQLLAHSEHLKYWRNETRGGGRYLPLNLIDGLVTARDARATILSVEWKTEGLQVAERLLGKPLPHRAATVQTPCVDSLQRIRASFFAHEEQTQWDSVSSTHEQDLGF
jgi:hypothetical protein